MLPGCIFFTKKVRAQVTGLLKKIFWHTLASLSGVVCVYFGKVTIFAVNGHTGKPSQCCMCLLWELQSSQWMAFLCITVDTTSISSDIRPWLWIIVLTDYCLNRSYFSFFQSCVETTMSVYWSTDGPCGFLPRICDHGRMALSLTGLVSVSTC